jgi:hypothetical protein
MNDFFKNIQKQKIMIATPCYNGQVSAFYMKSMIQLFAMAAKNDIEMHFFSMTTESLIPRARNYCVDEFLRSSCTHLVFLDADIEFNPLDVLALVELASDPENDKDVICGPYPLKEIAWEKVKYAVDKGFADKGSGNLVNYAVDYVFNLDKGIKSFNINEPLKVSESGTGFMCIRRKTFEIFKDNHPELEYVPDHLRSDSFSGENTIWCFFDTEIDAESRRYLSEDYYFCRKVSKMGLNVYVCPWMKLNHIGNYKFIGNLEEQAKAGLSYGVMKGVLN